MAKIPLPNPPVGKSLSFEDQASLVADAQFLRRIMMGEPKNCQLQRRKHFWQCEYCSLVRKHRPACVLGRADAGA